MFGSGPTFILYIQIRFSRESDPYLVNVNPDPQPWLKLKKCRMRFLNKGFARVFRFNPIRTEGPHKKKFEILFFHIQIG